MIPFRGLNADYSEKEIRKCQNLFQITPKSDPNLVPSKRYDAKNYWYSGHEIHKKWGTANLWRLQKTFYDLNVFPYEFTKFFTMI
jgi:hypothetical protein